MGCTVKNQIIVVFSNNVFKAIISSQTWSQETREIKIRYLKMDAFPAQLIIISMTVDWISCYHFINSVYRS